MQRAVLMQVEFTEEKKKRAKRELQEKAQVLEETLARSSIEAKVGHIHCGPTITSFEVHPAIGVKVQKIKALENDIALLAYHLPLDAHRDVGNNWVAAKDLGWKNLDSFGTGPCPFGVKGTLPQVPIKRFVKTLEVLVF